MYEGVSYIIIALFIILSKWEVDYALYSWIILCVFGVGANPIPNCKLGFGSCVRSDCVQTLSSFINYVGENDWVN